MATKTVKIRNTYAKGDRIILRKDTAPKHILEYMERNPSFDLVIDRNLYAGNYNLHVVDRANNDRVVQQYTLLTKYFTKGSTKELLVKAMEDKQTALRKYVAAAEREIEGIKAQITLMDELGVTKVNDLDLEYATRVSERSGIPLSEAYKMVSDVK